MQFADFVEPLAYDVRDLTFEQLATTRRSIVTRLRRRWIRLGRKLDEGVPSTVISHVLGVHGGVLVLGLPTCPFGPATPPEAARRVGAVAHRAHGVCELVIAGACGAAVVAALTHPHGCLDWQLQPSTLRLCDKAVNHRPPISRIQSARTVRIEDLATDVSLDAVPALLENLSQMPHLEEVDLRGVCIEGESPGTRHLLLGADQRSGPARLWSGLCRLESVTRLSIEFTKLESRSSAGLAKAINEMPSLRELRAIDRTGCGSLDLDYSKLTHMQSLEIVTDTVHGLGAMRRLHSLQVVSLHSPPGFPDNLVSELKELARLERLEIRLPRFAWRWMSGLADVPGIDELVLAAHVDARLPEQPVTGPVHRIESILRPAGRVGDARISAPRRSCPRTITVSSRCLQRRRDSGVDDAVQVAECLLRTGVRESVRFVGRAPGDDVVVAVQDLMQYARHLRHPQGRP